MGQEFGQWSTERRTASAPHLRPQLEHSKAGGWTPLKAHSLTVWRLTLVLAETLPGVLAGTPSTWPLHVTWASSEHDGWVPKMRVPRKRASFSWSSLGSLLPYSQVRGIPSPCPPSRGENHKPSHGWEGRRTMSTCKNMWNGIFMGMPVLGKHNLPHLPFLIQINSPQPWSESWCSVINDICLQGTDSKLVLIC